LRSKDSRAVWRGAIGKVPVRATRWWPTLRHARFGGGLGEKAARTSLVAHPTPLSAAAQAWRCYDFQCQGSGTTFFRSSSFFSPLRMKRGGASKKRRLILLLSVGWVPPSLPPSGACLNLGTSIPVGSLNAAEGYTEPGLRLFSCTLVHLRNGFRTRTGSQKRSLGLYRVMGTSWAMAHTKPTSSRAMATVTTLACLPLATRRR
jgi:hypothetical protein